MSVRLFSPDAAIVDTLDMNLDSDSKFSHLSTVLLLGSVESHTWFLIAAVSKHHPQWFWTPMLHIRSELPQSCSGHTGGDD